MGSGYMQVGMCSCCVVLRRHLPEIWLGLEAFLGVSLLLKALQAPRLVLREGYLYNNLCL